MQTRTEIPPHAAAENEYAVEMLHISKAFGKTQALRDVSLRVRKGEIHALLGENGAGKTTLMNILYGLLTPDDGEIRIRGRSLRMRSARTAIDAGVCMVHQHFRLVGSFTAAQNILLGEEITGPFGIPDDKQSRRVVQQLSEEFGLPVDPDARVADLPAGIQQRVEILRALYRRAELLILDEPTAILTPQEIQALLHSLRSLADSGKTIIIITHKLREIMQAADTCTVIRRGENVATIGIRDTSIQQLSAMMVGSSLPDQPQKSFAAPGEVVLTVRDLHMRDSQGIPRLKGLSLQVRRGEIFGLIGVEGNGQTELVEAVTNLALVDRGEIVMSGVRLDNTSTRFTLQNRICTIHGDPLTYGLIPAFTVAENAVLKGFDKPPFSRRGLLCQPAIDAMASGLIRAHDIRPSGCGHMPAGALSGGNQQKLVFAREISCDPELLIAVQPTRGMDVGAIDELHRRLLALRTQGKAVLLISLDLDEILRISDTVGVLYDGAVTAVLPAQQARREHIGLWMAGGTAT